MLSGKINSKADGCLICLELYDRGPFSYQTRIHTTLPEGGQSFLVVVVGRRNGRHHQGLRIAAQAREDKA